MNLVCQDHRVRSVTKTSKYNVVSMKLVCTLCIPASCRKVLGMSLVVVRTMLCSVLNNSL